jgi:DNA-binding response OmpR family regulator
MKALVVDDDRVLGDVVAFTLRREGFEVFLAYDGISALTRWEEHQPDLIILDVNIPEIDGFAVCKQLREKTNTPIILLTVRGEEEDIIHGLNLGADDYIVKPFSPRQLVARANAVLRRVGQISTPSILKVEDLSFDPHHREVRISGGEAISLTPLENRLLEYLMLNAGYVLTTDSIIDYVWGPEGGDRDMLRQLVRRLRGKIEPDPAHPIYISTIPGLGYGFAFKRDID